MGIEVDFSGKIALVAGASSPLGARFAKILALAGAQVVLASRQIEKLKELRAEIEASGGAAHVVSLDVTQYASIKSAIAHAETETGPIDILVNNASVSTTQNLLDVTPEDYAYIVDTNQRGAFFVAQETAKRMLTYAKGHPKSQHRIINIASSAGLRVLPNAGIYCMSKAAIIQMTKAMALEWGAHGITVNAICPGYHSMEPHTRRPVDKNLSHFTSNHVAKPSDLDGLLLLLAAEESHFINGAIITADDGMSI